MDAKSNRSLRKFLYEIVLMGLILCLGFGTGGSALAHAQPAAPYSNPIFLPLVFRAPASQMLSVNMTGTGSGAVTSSPPGIDCTASCSAPFNYNTNVTLTAITGTDSIFAGWSGSDCSGSDTCVVKMDAPKAVTATFTKSYTLRIGLSGTGSGKVTSQPPGIDCGSICTYSFAENTLVTLTAAPVPPSTFSGWSLGDCSGTGTCQVMMNAGRQAVAVFNLRCSGIGNCDFEEGSDGRWIEYSSNDLDIISDCSNPLFCNNISPHSGMYLAWFGGNPGEISYIEQQISVTSQARFLVYWQWVDAFDSCTANYAQVLIKGTQVDKYGLCPATSTENWVTHSIDLTAYAGQTVTLRIRTVSDATSYGSLYIDDVSLQASP